MHYVLTPRRRYHKEKETRLTKAHVYDITAESRDQAQELMECVLHGIDIGHPSFSWEEECVKLMKFA